MAVGVLSGHRQETAPGKSALDQIGEGLGVAKNIFGIVTDISALKEHQAQTEKLGTDTDKAKADLARTTAFNDALQKPDSIETKTTKAGANALLSSLVQSKAVNQDQVAPILQIVNDPGTTGAQVHQTFEGSPFLKDLTDLAGKKYQAEATANAANARVAPQNVKNQSQANQQYSQEIKPFEDSITSSNRVLGIIKQIKNGGLKSTPTLANDLSSAVGQMFNNGKSATVYQQAHNTLDSLEGSSATRWGYVSGQPMNTITPEQLDQLAKDTTALRNEYSIAHANNWNSFKEGLDPSLTKGLQRRYDSFRSSALKAPKAPPHGPTVQQGDHTFNWNPDTEKYE